MSWLALWVAVVAFVTLWPFGPARQQSLASFLCVWCDWRDTSDIVLNWLLFLPGGFLLAQLFSARRAMSLSVACTLSIECLQVAIASRDPALQDLLANTGGAATGVLLVVLGSSPLVRSVLVLTAAAAWLSPVMLLSPAVSGTDLLTEWTPFERGRRFAGEVVDVRVDGDRLDPGPVHDPLRLEASLADRAHLTVTVVPGPPQEALVPLVVVSDPRAHHLLYLGVVREDLVFRDKTLALRWRFDHPPHRWDGALETLGATPTTIEVDRDSGCIVMSGTPACGVMPSLGAGWGFFVNLDRERRAVRILATMLWCLALGAAIGLGTRSIPLAAALSGLVGLGGVLLAAGSPDVRGDGLEVAVMVAGALAVRLAGLSMHNPAVEGPMVDPGEASVEVLESCD